MLFWLVFEDEFFKFKLQIPFPTSTTNTIILSNITQFLPKRKLKPSK